MFAKFWRRRKWFGTHAIEAEGQTQKPHAGTRHVLHQTQRFGLWVGKHLRQIIDRGAGHTSGL
jgi:hypothetical protein